MIHTYKYSTDVNAVLGNEPHVLEIEQGVIEFISEVQV